VKEFEMSLERSKVDVQEIPGEPLHGGAVVKPAVVRLHEDGDTGLHLTVTSGFGDDLLAFFHANHVACTIKHDGIDNPLDEGAKADLIEFGPGGDKVRIDSVLSKWKKKN
jgi:hypothetical protein